MLADSNPPDRNRHSEPGSTPADAHRQQQELRRARSLIRLLKSSDDDALEDQELREEFDRLNNLLQRIDQIAQREELRSDEPEEPAPFSEPETEVEPIGAVPVTDVDQDSFPLDPDLEPFSPHDYGAREHHEAERPDEPVDAAFHHGEAQDEPAGDAADDEAGMDPPEQEATRGTDENLARWWVNFNGDISLERLAKLRALLNESPFTIETRFEEITDGLIVLRVVTDRHISMEQVDWIVRQMMDSVGLDRNSAIVSRQ